VRAFAPNGSPILGTLEYVPAVALITSRSYVRRPNGRVGFDWASETQLFADKRETVWRNGQPIYLAADGGEIPENEIILKEED
jgi:hypothetical protein